MTPEAIVAIVTAAFALLAAVATGAYVVGRFRAAHDEMRGDVDSHQGVLEDLIQHLAETNARLDGLAQDLGRLAQIAEIVNRHEVQIISLARQVAENAAGAN